jgi:hypothetical protein
MVDVMQNNQITKSSEGQSMLPPALSWNDHGGEFTNKETMTSTNMRNPQKLVSFDDFYGMFKKYQNQIDEDDNNETSNVNESKQAKVSTNSIFSNDIDEKSNNNEVIGNRSSMDLSVEFAERNEVDILENLKERDPQFEAYKMMTLRNKPQGRMLIKQSAKLVKTRKMRQVPPLGRLATVLMDSKGKVMKESLKGFRNSFKDLDVNESSGSEDEEDDEDKLDTDIYDDDNAISTNEVAAESASPSQKEKNNNVAGEVHFDIPDRKSKSRSRSRGRSRGKDRKTGVISADNHDNSGADEPEMQTKLVLAWDSMQVPASHRLGFMKKYSTAIYAVVFTRATDMWSESAVFALARLEIIKLVKRLKVGSLVYPLNSSSLVDNITRCIPPLLASSSTSLIPVEFAEGILVESQNEPLSSTALKSIINAILNIFSNICNTESITNEFNLPDDIDNDSPPKIFTSSKGSKSNKSNKSNKGSTKSSRFSFSNNSNILTNSSASDERKAKLCIKEIGFWIDMSLDASLTRAKELLEDTIPYGVSSCKEWIESTSQLLSVDPPPPPVIKENEKKDKKK